MNRTGISLIAAFIFLPFVANAQVENPRGIYKMMTLTGKQGEIKAPFDQYKICTDSVTLMLNVQGRQFSLGNTDKNVLNFTGEEADAHDATATRIFNSNANHFTLKWWSTTPSHLYFPHNDWCTEYYESGQYSENAKVILDALSSPTATDHRIPFIGTWRMVGMMDELRDTKRQLEKLREGNRFKTNIGYLIFTPDHVIMYSNSRSGGSIDHVAYASKKKIMIGKNDANNTPRRATEHAITWFGKDCFAMEVQLEGYRTDHEIWERVTDTTPLLNKIASRYISGSR
ncbi:MAG: hypothetical protein J5529_01565 [Prevotella sp.]|nr:hypothetical protein [Prevotella sp.]